MLAGATLIRGALFTLTGSIAFWTKRSRSLIEVNLNLLEKATFYPLAIYPFAIQVLFTFLIPIGFISFYPACEFLQKEDRSPLPLEWAIWTPIIGCLFFALAIFVFKKGLKNYESSGS